MNTTIHTMLLAAMIGAAIIASPGDAEALEAGSPNISSTGGLSVSFSDTVERHERVVHTLSYDMTATFVCGTLRPRTSLLPRFIETTSSSGSRSVAISADLNGRLRGTIGSDLPRAPTTLHCPAGYEPLLANVQYENIRLESKYGAVEPPGQDRIFIPLSS